MKKPLFKLLFFSVTLCIFVALLSSCTLSNSNSNSKTNSSQKEIYNVSENYFDDASYSLKMLTTVQVQGGGIIQTPMYSISSQCSVSLFEYTATIYCYSVDEECIGVKTINKTQDIDANQTFTFDFIIDDQSLQSTSFIEVVFEGQSYEKPNVNNYKYTVVFVYNNGQPDTTVKVTSGKTLNQPSDPEKKNYLFVGWYTDKKLTNRFSFSQRLESNLTLYAKYTIDAVSISNRVSMEVMSGIIKVYNKCYTTSSSGTSWQTHTGSGFCFYREDGTYYILTNCHVAEKDSNFKRQEFTVEDYQGHTFTAYLYSNSNKMGTAISNEYDLACLYFTISGSSSIKPLTLAKAIPQIGEDIISIGAPEGQSNFFVFGKTIAYKNPTMPSNSSINIPFNVLEHNAYVDRGSSGGPVLNANLEVVGINFAHSERDFYNSAENHSFAIPVYKIKEFLNLYVYK